MGPCGPCSPVSPLSPCVKNKHHITVKLLQLLDFNILLSINTTLLLRIATIIGKAMHICSYINKKVINF